MMRLSEVGLPAVIVMLVSLPLLILGNALFDREDGWRFLGRFLLLSAIPYIGAAEVLGFAIIGPRVAVAVITGAIIGAIPFFVALKLSDRLVPSAPSTKPPSASPGPPG